MAEYRTPPARDVSPPTHDGYPVIGNTHQLVREQNGLFEAAAADGDVVRLRLLGIGDFYQVNHPALAEQILVNQDGQFRKASMSQEDLGDLIGQGLVLSEGELWERQRDRIEPAFYMDRIAEYADTMTREIQVAADEWLDAERINIEDEMKALTLRILVKSMFGSDIDYESRGIRETVKSLQEPGQPSKQPIARMIPRWVPIPMWRRYKRGIAEMEAFIAETIDERRDEEPRDDLLAMLLTGTDEDGETMSEKLVRDEMMTFLFAGHETTATALTFTWYLLAQNPDIEHRLFEEVAEVLTDGYARFDDVPELTYTQQVLREGMRLYPPVPSIPRETTEPVELGGYTVPAGETVAPMQWTIHRDDRFWDDPGAFRPERFDGDTDRPAFAYFPFGGGPRRCIGKQFALVEGTLILATLIHRYRLHLVSDSEIDLSVSITTRPLDPIEMRVESRSA